MRGSTDQCVRRSGRTRGSFLFLSALAITSFQASIGGIVSRCTLVGDEFPFDVTRLERRTDAHGGKKLLASAS